MSLKSKLNDHIKTHGDMRLDQYFEACLWDLEYGYYRKEKVFGAQGDFVTSPEISQIFGEIIGLWALQSWIDIGKPERFLLLEMGAGRGEMMRDVLRTTAISKPFMDCVEVSILEKSEQRRQEQQAANVHKINFIDDLNLPKFPALIFSNEFFDALPIRQFRQDGGGWLEAFVGLDLKKNWKVCPRPPLIVAPYQDTSSVVEINEVAANIMKILGDHIHKFGGSILSVDYGAWDGVGDSLQALSKHEYTDPFLDPGEADITAHVRFRDLAKAAELDCNFMTQNQFLESYGAKERLDKLCSQNPMLAEKLKEDYGRMVDQNAMGDLFKVLIQRG